MATTQAFYRGLSVAVRGFIKRVMQRDPIVHRAFWHFIARAYFPILLILYILSMILAVLIFPITIAIIFFMPSVLWQYATIVPIFGLYIAEWYNPISTEQLFILSLHSIDSQLANKFRNEAEKWSRKSQSCGDMVKNSVGDQLYFLLCLVLCFLLSFIPIIGIVLYWIVYTYMVSVMLSWSLMDVYMRNIRHFNKQAQTQFMNQHKALLIGFCIPYTALTVIPVLGPMLIGYAKASIADLFYQEVYTVNDHAHKLEV